MQTSKLKLYFKIQETVQSIQIIQSYQIEMQET